MRMTSLLRAAGLAVVLAIALPAPASPQLGKWVKKAIKQKIADKVEQTVLGPDSSSPPAPAGGRTGASRVTKGTSAPAAPVSDEYNIDLTSDVLDKVEKGLAAEEADRKLAAQEAAKILSKDAYDKCMQRGLASPEGQKVYQAYTATLHGTDQELMAQSEERNRVAQQMEEFFTGRCGPGGSKADDVRSELMRRPEKTGQEASGLSEYRYGRLKERIVPFCSLPQPPAPVASGQTRVPAGTGFGAGLFYVYTPAEIAVLQPRCAKLMAGINLGQPGAPNK